MIRSPALASLCVSNLTKTWQDGQRQVKVTLETLVLMAGNVQALVGPSGCGKSTVLGMLALVLRPDATDRFELCDATGVTKDLAPVLQCWDSEMLSTVRARDFAFVPQTGGLIPFLTVWENILLQQRISHTLDLNYAAAVTRHLNIADLLDAFPSQLSIGQRQRVAFARAAACRPRLLFADEPTAALDPAGKRSILRLCFELIEGGHTTVLLVSHERTLLEECRIPLIEAEGEEIDSSIWHTRFRGPQ
jgi:putative ABC transport system ATP-binding protein